MDVNKVVDRAFGPYGGLQAQSNNQVPIPMTEIQSAIQTLNDAINRIDNVSVELEMKLAMVLRSDTPVGQSSLEKNGAYSSSLSPLAQGLISGSLTLDAAESRLRGVLMRLAV